VYAPAPPPPEPVDDSLDGPTPHDVTDGLVVEVTSAGAGVAPKATLEALARTILSA
jgi:hypothetical protein